MNYLDEIEAALKGEEMRSDCITMATEIKELESERDALRAEVERYKRAVRLAAEAAWDGDPRRAQEIDLAVQQAIAEAGKE